LAHCEKALLDVRYTIQQMVVWLLIIPSWSLQHHHPVDTKGNTFVWHPLHGRTIQKCIALKSLKISKKNARCTWKKSQVLF